MKLCSWRRSSVTKACYVLFVLLAGTASGQLVPTDDSFVKASNNTNHGNAQSLDVIQAAQSSSTFVRFNLSSLPAGINGSAVAKATLRMFVLNVNSPGTLDVRRISATWQEDSVTGNASPALGTPVASVAIAATDGGNFIEVDVTPVVKEWLNGTLPNNGVALVPNGNPLNVSFSSKENTSPSHESELLVSLNGPAGPQGQPGLTGATGPVGPVGATGPAGPIGLPGPAGAAGVAGPAGPIGLTGPAGAAGVAGPAGPIGLTGPIGAAGATGPAGPIGLTGPAGAAGVAGPAGPIGLTGPVGVAGVAGPAGPIGLTGPAGTAGVAGPAGPIGLTGPAGAAGVAGPAGPLGPQGTTGATGPQGTTGAQGPPGVTFTRTVIVSPVGTPAQNGTALLSAVLSLGQPPAANPYLVRIEPGTYDLGTQSLIQRSFIDIEGSGVGVTKITSSAASYTVVVEASSELRNITIESTAGFAIALSGRLLEVVARASGGSSNTAIAADSPAESITNTTAIAFGPGVVNRAIQINGSAILTNVIADSTGFTSTGRAVDIGGTGSPRLVNVYAHAAGTGTQNVQAISLQGNMSATLQSVNARAENGGGAGNMTAALYVSQGTSRVANSILSSTGTFLRVTVQADSVADLWIENSQLSNQGYPYSVSVNGAGTVVRIGASRVEGVPFLFSGGVVTCAAIYTPSMTFFANTCQ